jgi:hypothetical protein
MRNWEAQKSAQVIEKKGEGRAENEKVKMENREEA